MHRKRYGRVDINLLTEFVFGSCGCRIFLNSSVELTVFARYIIKEKMSRESRSNV